MVKVIEADPDDHTDLGGGQPEVHVRYIERDAFGNGIGIKVYGEIKMAAKEAVLAKELMLNTLQELQLTPEAPAMTGGIAYTVQKWISRKGEYDNYASVDIFRHLVSDGSVAELTAGHDDAPYDGSIWLNFEAVGE